MLSYLNNYKCFIIISIILLLCIGFYIISLSDNNVIDDNISISDNFIHNNENYDIKFNNKPNLSLYFATWCGHCNTFKPIWEQIKNDQNNLQFCDFYTIDCSGDKPETSINKSPNGTDIDGFPTIILSINNKDIIYQGSRTKKEIENFIKKQI
jgi:thiol-disulfide isomerase/thioredoxin